MKVEVSGVAYDTWFSETELYELTDSTAKVIVPMHIHKKRLKENYNAEKLDEIIANLHN